MRIIFTIMGLLCVIAVSACDICGCSVGGNYLGILPNYQRHFIGTRYRFSQYHSVHPEGNSFGDDYFHTIELWARYVPNKRLQFYGNLPFQFMKRKEGDEFYKVNHVGDASILVSGILFNTSDSLLTKWKQVFQVGGGVKLPTGKNNIIQNQRTLPANIQPGTGSFDFLMNTIYTLRYKKMGVNLDASYRLNTTNSNYYQMGNRLTLSARLFYWKNVSLFSFLPHVGMDYESSEADKKNKRSVAFTGGELVMSSVGLDVYYHNFSLGFSLQNPVTQQLNNGQTKNSIRTSLQFIYLF